MITNQSMELIAVFAKLCCPTDVSYIADNKVSDGANMQNKRIPVAQQWSQAPVSNGELLRR